MPSRIINAAVQDIDGLTQMIWQLHEQSEPSKRVLVSVSGVPGAGKSTLARKLAENLNSWFRERRDKSSLVASAEGHATPSNSAPRPFAVDVPMDGFHLSRAQLRSMPDSETAIHRRGAAFTFDSAGYYCLVELLSKSNCSSTGETVYAPAFDHATKDPVADSIEIGSETRIIVLEGNYVNLDREPWSNAAQLFDLKLSAFVDRTVARERLVKRHVLSGICPDEASARWRVKSTDDSNADDIEAHEVPGVISVRLGEIH